MLRADGKPSPDAVHTSASGMAGNLTKRLTHDQALSALTQDGITACPYCRPDTDLGAL
ncbi:DUF6233 domain-containing protein [Streptomyces sp. NPDC006208]|uniref:DUF6233 domain-containing protein n=1 Tax=Streptomyces sp. NPDC006208 TaxID=3156734 RepID=UPI0033B88FE7